MTNSVSPLTLLRIALTSENINYKRTHPNEIKVCNITPEPLIKLQEICIDLPTTLLKLNNDEYDLFITVPSSFEIVEPFKNKPDTSHIPNRQCWLLLRAYLYWHGEQRTIKNVWLDSAYVNSSLSIGGYMKDRNEVEFISNLVTQIGYNCGRRIIGDTTESLIFPGNFLNACVFVE